MSTCQKCGTPYTDGRIFCGQCKHIVGIRCVCGQGNTPSDKYCGHCGATLHMLTNEGQGMHRDPPVPSQRKGAAKSGKWNIVDEVKSETAHFNRLAKRMHRDDIKSLFKSRKVKK